MQIDPPAVTCPALIIVVECHMLVGMSNVFLVPIQTTTPCMQLCVNAHIPQMLVKSRQDTRELLGFLNNCVAEHYRFGLTSVPAHTWRDNAQEEWLVGVV